MPKTRKKILILGGGFGGIYCARRLDKLLGRDPSIEITLVDRDNYFLFTPMLHEVAASDLEITNIVSPIRQLLHHARFFCGDVQSVDLDAKKITVSHGFDHHTHDLRYDDLVLALGSTTNFHELPGVEENSVTMKTLGDAIHLRNLVIEHLEEADTDCTEAAREGLLTFVVCGGGFAGIETIASINDLVRDALRFYPHIDPKSVRMIVIHQGELILPELGPELGKYAQEKLRKRGVEIRTNCRVESADEGSVTIKGGEVIPTRTLIWTAGVTPHAVVGSLPSPHDHGRIKVSEFLELREWPGVFAIGDCAWIPDPTTGKPRPPTAQHAIREARVAADNLIAHIRGGKKKPFQYKMIGQLASIGHRAGVANIFGLKFSGFIAWWLWRTIYLSKLPRLEKKLRVALAWTLDLLFPKDLVQFQTMRAPTMSRDSAEHLKRAGEQQ